MFWTFSPKVFFSSEISMFSALWLRWEMINHSQWGKTKFTKWKFLVRRKFNAFYDYVNTWYLLERKMFCYFKRAKKIRNKIVIAFWYGSQEGIIRILFLDVLSLFLLVYHHIIKDVNWTWICVFQDDKKWKHTADAFKST